jgi:hypothetical protein
LLHSLQLSRQEPGGSSGRGCRHFGFLYRSGVLCLSGSRVRSERVRRFEGDAKDNKS